MLEAELTVSLIMLREFSKVVSYPSAVVGEELHADNAVAELHRDCRHVTYSDTRDLLIRLESQSGLFWPQRIVAFSQLREREPLRLRVGVLVTEIEILSYVAVFECHTSQRSRGKSSELADGSMLVRRDLRVVIAPLARQAEDSRIGHGTQHQRHHLIVPSVADQLALEQGLWLEVRQNHCQDRRLADDRK